MVGSRPPLPEGGGTGGRSRFYSGIAGQINVAPPRIESEVTLDGALDEPAWQQAAVLSNFSQYQPSDGRPAEDSTTVLVWYSPSAIYFGIRAYEGHGAVNANLADRDKIESNDFIQILLDTFNDQRQALIFGVNPLGVQSDGIRADANRGKQQSGGGISFGQPETDGSDLNPDFVYRSKGRLTDYGYEVEVRIPFKSLRYQSASVQQWGLHLLRKVQHSGYQDTWAPAKRANASFMTQAGRLTGLTGFHRGLVLDLNPVMTSKVTGLPAVAPATNWNYDASRPEFGGNVRWGITSNLTLNGTVNPDFSQVEADVGQAPPDPRFAVSFPEKRPFFVEGSEYYETRNQLVYTRRIADPISALKLAGRVAGTTVGILSAVDGKGVSLTGTDYPVYNIARIKRDFGSRSTLGMAYTDRIEGSNYNRVGELDLRTVFSKLYTLDLQAAGSLNRASGVRTSAPLWEAQIDRNGREYGFNWRITGIHPDFRAASGFLRRTGIITTNARSRITKYGKPGATVESFTSQMGGTATWDYLGLPHGSPLLQHIINWSNTWNLRGGWNLNVTPLWETVQYDQAFFSTYRIERPRAGGGYDTIPYVNYNRIHDFDLIFRVTTPQFSRFSATFGPLFGHDIDFLEHAHAWLISVDGQLNWRPTDKLRVEFKHTHQQFIRGRDNSKFSVINIPRLKLEYQLSRPIFFRFVGQYEARMRDAFYDPRDGSRMLVLQSDGSYAQPPRQVSNNLRVDWLFSFQPNPGTVFFLGYGSSLTEPDAFKFRDISRTTDGFFVKLSYLWRMK